MAEISRRSFLEDFFYQKETSKRLYINTNLGEFTPKLNRLQVAHLLRRTSFSVSKDLLDVYTGKNASEIVDLLFDQADKNLNPSPPYFSGDKIRNPANLSGTQKKEEESKVNKHNGDYNYELGEWWVKLMRANNSGILEKMTLFWHGHFASQFAVCPSIPALMMYRQNDLLRKNYAGNLRTLLEKLTIDGAMLRYLNGAENNSDSPNENYARELMELFSIGVGNYSEQDVREAAKILTGWKVTMFTDEGLPYEGYLNPINFDKNTKLFMGEVFNVNYEINQQNVYENSVKKLISVLLNKKAKEAATFMSQKIYKFFVYANPEKVDKKVIDQMAQLLLDNNFDTRPLLKTLFKSQHFFDDLNIGVQIKSPAETLIGFTRHFVYNDRYVRNMMAVLGQELFNPPNVAGWRGYRSWISTKTLPQTIYFLVDEILITFKNDALGEWIKSISEFDNPKKLVEGIAELFFSRPISPERVIKFTNILLAGAPDYEWYDIVKNKEQAGLKVRVLLKEIIKSPDYYLS